MAAIEEIIKQAAEASQGGKRAVEQVGLRILTAAPLKIFKLVSLDGCGRCLALAVEALAHELAHDCYSSLKNKATESLCGGY